MPNNTYQTFKEFYPYYLSEHKHPINKLLHLFGTILGIIIFLILMTNNMYLYFPLSFIPGYFFAWVGHFIFEKNRPATFKYPFFSFCGDWVMLKDIITGKIKI